MSKRNYPENRVTQYLTQRKSTEERGEHDPMLDGVECPVLSATTIAAAEVIRSTDGHDHDALKRANLARRAAARCAQVPTDDPRRIVCAAIVSACK